MEIFTEYRGQIFEAFWTTIQLTIYSAIGALILGTALGAMRLAPVPMLNWIGTTYVNVVRNTPLTLIILFCSFGLSQTLGITLVDPESLTSIEDSNFRLAVLGLTVYTAAFVCETVRSGVNTVPLGQAEAARSLGLTFRVAVRTATAPGAGLVGVAGVVRVGPHRVAVQRGEEHVLALVEDLLRAIAMVVIDVEHGDTAARRGGVLGGDGGVVEEAVAAVQRRRGVVAWRPAQPVRHDVAIQHGVGRRQRAVDRRPCRVVGARGEGRRRLEAPPTEAGGDGGRLGPATHPGPQPGHGEDIGHDVVGRP